MNYFKVIWYIIFSKKFRYMFKNTVLYAINNYDEKRGDGASDVLLFKSYYWNKYQGNKMNYFALSQLNKRFDQFCREKLSEEILDEHIQDSVIQSQLPIFKYEYKCRTLGCCKIIRSQVALSKNYHFCLNCIK